MAASMKALIALNIMLLALVGALMLLMTAKPADAAKQALTVETARIVYVTDGKDCGPGGALRKTWGTAAFNYATGYLQENPSGSIVAFDSNDELVRANVTRKTLTKCKATIVTGVSLR